MYGEFCIFPEVGRLAGFGASGIVVVGDVCVSADIPGASAVVGERAGGVESVGRIEHVVMIYGEGHDRHRDGFVDKVGLRGGVGGQSVHKFGAADYGVLGNLFGLRNLFRTLGGEGAIEGAADFAAFFRGGRLDGQVRIEARLREETFLGLMVVFVILESARR